MATRIDLPSLGQSMEEGTITVWHKREGDIVQEGETLYEVMTDKANIEQPSPASGILRKILVGENESVPVKSLIGIIAGADEAIEHLISGNGNVAEPASDPSGTAATPTAAAAIPFASASKSPGDDGDRIFSSPRARRVAGELGVDVASLAGHGTGIGGRIVEIDILNLYKSLDADKRAGKITPLAKAVAAEHGVDLAVLSGTGAQGRVTRDDVHRAIVPPAPAAPDTGEGDRIIPLVGMRKMIADNVTRSAMTAPHVTLTLSVDMGEATRFRKVLPSIEKSHGVRISFTDIIAKAAARALQDHPMLNSTLNGNSITLHRSIHLGVAVSLGEAGLVVPVVRNAESKNLAQISASIKELAGKAKEGRLSSEEMTGGTFSITNLGTFGIESFTPIIAPPQCAILGVCAIKEQPAVVDGKIEVRPIMNLSLSFDHRITDGAPAAAFLARLKEILELPYLIFA